MAKLPPIEIIIPRRRSGYSKPLNTFGDHIKAKRLDAGIKAKDLAPRLGIDIFSLINWESGQNMPSIVFWPRIVDFLGYCPVLQKPQSIGQKVRLKRSFEGLTSKQLAEQISLDQSTLLKWEKSDTEPRITRVRQRMESYLNS